MIFKIDGGKSVRVPMHFSTFGFLNSWTVKVRDKDLDLFAPGTIFKQVNQHKEKSGSMASAPEDVWLITTNNKYSLGDEWVVVCKPIKTNLEYLEIKSERKKNHEF